MSRKASWQNEMGAVGPSSGRVATNNERNSMTSTVDHAALVERLHRLHSIIHQRDDRINFDGRAAKEGADAIAALVGRVERLEAAIMEALDPLCIGDFSSHRTDRKVVEYFRDTEASRTALINLRAALEDRP